MLLHNNISTLLTVAVTICAWVVQGEKVGRDEVQQLADSFMDFRLRENPFFASEYGIPKYQDQIQDWNHEVFARRLMKVKDYQKQVDGFLLRGTENEQDDLSLRILKDTLQKYIDGAKYMQNTIALHAELIFLDTKIKFTKKVDTLDKLKLWFSRVKLFPQVYDDQIALIDEAVEAGTTSHNTTCDNVIAHLTRIIGDSVDTFFGFKPWIDLDIMTSNRTFYDEGRAACELMRNSMITYRDKIQNDYLPVCRESPGLSALPNGAENYEVALRFHTADDVTPQYTHDLGLRETKRITDQMKEIMRKEGFTGSIREFVNDVLFKDPTLTFNSSEAVNDAFFSMLNNKVKPVISSEFNPQPHIALEILDDPYGSIGRYQNPLPDGSGGLTPGIFIYDGSKPEQMLLANMLPILIHETIPGHHYQLGGLMLADLPDLRKYPEYANSFQNSYNFPVYNAYIEGWGLYAEYLGEKMGIIKTDRERFGRLSLEGLRAARLVVDTGIHYYNWTFDKAVEYLANNTALDENQCVGQIKRYVSIPGQACAYKIGELRIIELREKAMKTLGDSFDPREFHDAVLAIGPCPLSILEEQINHWIDGQMVSAASPTHKMWAAIAALVAALYVFL